MLSLVSTVAYVLTSKVTKLCTDKLEKMTCNDYNTL